MNAQRVTSRSTPAPKKTPPVTRTRGIPQGSAATRTQADRTPALPTRGKQVNTTRPVQRKPATTRRPGTPAVEQKRARSDSSAQDTTPELPEPARDSNLAHTTVPEPVRTPDAYILDKNSTASKYMLNDFECDMMIDNKIFHHVTGYVMYQQYVASGDIASAEHILQQTSALYCRVYWREHPIKSPCESGTAGDVLKRAIYRGIACKFVSNENMLGDLSTQTGNAAIHYSHVPTPRDILTGVSTADIAHAEELHVGPALVRVRGFLSAE
jgi:predicted NAD-dependent protein-ADP-ribosyltransferase YbiA (DUF1768 family)